MLYRKPETPEEVPYRPAQADTVPPPFDLFNGQSITHQRLVGSHWIIGRQRRGRFCCKRGRARIEVV